MDRYNPAEMYDVHRIVGVVSVVLDVLTYGLVMYYIYWMLKQK